MPHVILRGSVTAEDIWLNFAPREWSEGSTHYKAQECYLDSSKHTVLIRSVVVERGFSKSFFIRINDRGGSLMVALEGLASPERTDAVKRYIGTCAWTLMQAVPDLVVETSNIPELVRGPDAP